MTISRAGEVDQTSAKARWPCRVLILLCGGVASPAFWLRCHTSIIGGACLDGYLIFSLKKKKLKQN